MGINHSGIVLTFLAFPSRISYVGLFFWIIGSINGENIEIVTPENTKTHTAEVGNATNFANDSYLTAYEEVHKMRLRPIKRNDFEMQDVPKPGGYNTVIRSTYMSDDRYPSLTEEWAPTRSPSPPVIYGHPHSHSHHYHEVVPPTQSCRPVPYSSPSNDYFGFLPKKLSLKILLKIILKLVLFKMIIKFIAVICLLLFIPLLKSKETHSGSDDDDMKRMRSLDMMSDYIWNGISEKDALYDGDEEMSDLRDIVKEDEEDENDENNVFARPTKAIRFLEFCVTTVDRVVGYLLGVLKKQRETEGEDIASFVLDKFDSFVKSMSQ